MSCGSLERSPAIRHFFTYFLLKRFSLPDNVGKEGEVVHHICPRPSTPSPLQIISPGAGWDPLWSQADPTAHSYGAPCRNSPPLHAAWQSSAAPHLAHTQPSTVIHTVNCESTLWIASRQLNPVPISPTGPTQPPSSLVFPVVMPVVTADILDPRQKVIQELQEKAQGTGSWGAAAASPPHPPH